MWPKSWVFPEPEVMSEGIMIRVDDRTDGLVDGCQAVVCPKVSPTKSEFCIFKQKPVPQFCIKYELALFHNLLVSINQWREEKKKSKLLTEGMTISSIFSVSSESLRTAAWYSLARHSRKACGPL